MLGILWILTDKRIKSYNPSTGQYRIITNNNYLAEERKFGTIKFADDSVVVDGKDAILKIGQGIGTKKEQVVLSTVVVDGKSEYVRIDKDELVLPANAVNVELALLPSITRMHLISRCRTASMTANGSICLSGRISYARHRCRKESTNSMSRLVIPKVGMCRRGR